MWARFRQSYLSEGETCGQGFARMRFRHLVYEMSFTNVGEASPGQGFASLSE